MRCNLLSVDMSDPCGVLVESGLLSLLHDSWIATPGSVGGGCFLSGLITVKDRVSSVGQVLSTSLPCRFSSARVFHISPLVFGLVLLVGVIKGNPVRDLPTRSCER